MQRKATSLDDYRDLGYMPSMIYPPAHLHLCESAEAPGLVDKTMNFNKTLNFSHCLLGTTVKPRFTVLRFTRSPDLPGLYPFPRHFSILSNVLYLQSYICGLRVKTCYLRGARNKTHTPQQLYLSKHATLPYLRYMWCLTAVNHVTPVTCISMK